MVSEQTQYMVVIRNGRGELLTEGRSRGDWQGTATRLAKRAGLAARRDNIVSQQYFPTAAGSPIGTHHVQWGHQLSHRGESSHQMTAGNRYVVQVSLAE